MKPHSQDEHKQHTFEHYCKQILRNEKNDYHRELNQQGERKVLFCELPLHTLEQFAIWDKYFQDTYLFEIMGFEVAVADELLAEALKTLPQDRLEIVLLSYFLEMSDPEIAAHLNLIRRTVSHRRKNALRKLKKSWRTLLTNKNRKKTPGGLLPYPVIVSAVSGNMDAINVVLEHFAGFISLLSTRTMYDEQGKPIVYIDEELRRRLETKLIAKIPTFKVA